MTGGVLRSSLVTSGAVLVLALFGPAVEQNMADSNTRQDGGDGDTARLAAQGQQIFRFDTFGDEAFWGGTLMLHQAIEGATLGGIGPGVSPAAALSVGLKVDVDALPRDLLAHLQQGKVKLNDPAVTVQLLKLNAVVGVTGFFNAAGGLESMGIQCALCHSTVDNSYPALCAGAIQPNPGTGCVGHRLDGWPNRDLNVGAIIALAPNLSPLTTLLNAPPTTVKTVLNSWGPGKFDAELILDGKAFNPQQVSDGVTTGTNTPAATLIPPAFGLGGINLHTWTGWGSIPYWNDFVAVLEMHGVGRFFDSRLNDATQFPIAAANGFGNLNASLSPDSDQVTSKLQALQFYQLSIAPPQPPAGSFDPAAAARGDQLFSGKAKCNNCHVEPLWTEPAWNMHLPSDVCIDSFQADRAPDHRYRTSPIGELFTHFKGGFYHDGRFATLGDVVDHYNSCMSLGLASNEKSDLIQYLLSLTFGSPTGQAKSADRSARK